MAVLTHEWQNIGERSLYGQGFTVTMRIYGRLRSTGFGPGTAIAQFEYRIQPTTNFVGTWGNGGGIYTYDPVNGWVNRGTYVGDGTTNEQVAKTWEASFSGNDGADWNIQAYTIYAWFGANQSNTNISTTATITTPPAGLNITNIAPSTESFSADVSVTGWGGIGDASTRYKELNIYTYSDSGLVEPRRYEPFPGNNLSDNITANNSSYGSLNITGNTNYVIAGYATNGTWNTGLTRFTIAVTLPYAPTINFTSATANSATFSYSQPADGGYYTKYIEYSIDNGTTWNQITTSSSGSALSGTFQVTGLSASTSYTLLNRTWTNAGISEGASVSFATIGPDKAIIDSSSKTDSSILLEYSVNSFNGGTNPFIEVYEQRSSQSDVLIDTQSPAIAQNTYTYTHTNLSSNNQYSYYAIGAATFDGSVAYGEKSDTLSVVTLCPAPSLSVAHVQYTSIDKVETEITINVPQDKGYLSKNVQICYAAGSDSFNEWTTVSTVSTGSATSVSATLILDTQTVYRFKARSLQSGESDALESQVVSYTTPGDHTSPTGFDYIVEDSNTDVANWLSGFSGYVSPTFIQGKSQGSFTISEANKGVIYDNATLSSYAFSSLGLSAIKTTDFVYPIELQFASVFENRPTDLTYNTINIVGEIKDSLNATQTITKSAILISYENPSITASGTRLTEIGTARIDFEGQYSRIQANPLNSGEDMNSIVIEYRVLDASSEVISNWTQVQDYTTVIDEDKPFLKNFSGRVMLVNIPKTSTAIIEVRVSDHFTSQVSQVILEIWDKDKILYPPEYEIELWDWRSNAFLADLSYLIIGSLNLKWVLNDVEEVSFNIDLLRFEEKCQQMGVDPNDLLTPYAQDIRIRRNGVYIMGCNLVEVTINLPVEPPSQIAIKGSGYLNLFKDQYILSETWSGYTYAEIATKLIQAAQKPDCLIKNPTIDIDTSYWLAGEGIISYSTGGHQGKGYLSANRSGAGLILVGTQMSLSENTQGVVDIWVKGQAGVDINIIERQYMMVATGQQTIATITGDGNWQHISGTFTSAFENGYICIQQNRTDSVTLLCVDDAYVYEVEDNPSLNNLNVVLGEDTASAFQDNTREINLELQNVKDALMELTSTGEDNFDFEFLPDRTFNVLARKGSDKLNLEICYPGNISSMSIQRSASNLANKIIAIGSGIGDERLQTILYDNTSRNIFGTHESVQTDNNQNIIENLKLNARGILKNRKNPTNLPQIVISDGSINPLVVETGDIVLVEIQNDPYLSSTTGEYKIVQIECEVEENKETMTLILEETDEEWES